MIKGIITVVALTLASGQSFAGATVRTEICIENLSANTYYITGTDVDNHDWDDLYDNGAMNRPDHNWDNKELKPSEVRCELADINSLAGSVGFAFDITGPNLSAATKSRIQLSYKIEGRHIYPDYWLVLNDGSAPVGTPGRLRSHLHCLDNKDPVADLCTRFLISK